MTKCLMGGAGRGCVGCVWLPPLPLVGAARGALLCVSPSLLSAVARFLMEISAGRRPAGVRTPHHAAAHIITYQLP